MPGAGLDRELQGRDVVDHVMILARILAFAPRRRQPMDRQEIGRLLAAERDDPMLVEIRELVGSPKRLR